MEIFGILSAFFLVACGVPEAYHAVKYKTCRVPTALLWLWYFGEIFGAIYTLFIQDYILTLNYFCNIIIISVILFYWFKNRKDV